MLLVVAAQRRNATLRGKLQTIPKMQHERPRAMSTSHLLRMLLVLPTLACKIHVMYASCDKPAICCINQCTPWLTMENKVPLQYCYLREGLYLSLVLTEPHLPSHAVL
jgi:hypothetical protein